MVNDADKQLAQELSKYYADPLGYVMFSYPWDTDKSIQLCELPEPWASKYNSKYGPDKWACEFLERLGVEIKDRGFDGVMAVMPIRMDVVSGHGIGKSAMTGWLTNFITQTRPNSQGTVTANTGAQLESKTWPQIRKWTKKSIAGHWFKITSGRGSMRMAHKLFPESWFCTAQTCQKDNSEAFQGQHAADSTSWYINDEASAIPTEIFVVQDGGLTDGEPMQFSVGNPTRTDGEFREHFRKKRHRHICYQIDSRNVQITNKEFIKQLVEDNGEDSDYVRVRVRGLFPRASVDQLLAFEVVESAKDRNVSYHGHPRIMGMDVGLSLGGDPSAWVIVQGQTVQNAGEFRLADTFAVAGRFREIFLENQCTQGYIDSIGYGAGVADTLKAWGLPVIATNVGEASPENKHYFNLRSDLWWRTKLFWEDKMCSIKYKDFGDKAVMDKLMAELATYLYSYTPGKMLIKVEAKKEAMDRLKRESPNLGDAFMLTRNHASATAEVYTGEDSGSAIFLNFDNEALEGALL